MGIFNSGSKDVSVSGEALGGDGKGRDNRTARRAEAQARAAARRPGTVVNEGVIRTGRGKVIVDGVEK